MKCPNCDNEVEEDDLIPSFVTDSLLCCPKCKGKSKHIAVIGTDPRVVFGEANRRFKQRKTVDKQN